MSSGSASLRLANRHKRVLVISLVVLFFLFLCVSGFAILWRRGGTRFRTTALFVDNPVTLASWDATGKSLTVVTVSPEVAIKDTDGAGLTIEALYRLGDINPVDNARLESAVEDTFGVPVTWYLGAVGDIPSRPDASKIWAPGRAIDILTGRLRSTVGFFGFLRAAITLSRIAPERITRIDLSTRPATTDEILADGSVIHVLDKAKLDPWVGRLFEDDGIRGESKTLAIYNTTSTPALGASVARLLGHVGVNVTFVGNEDTPVSGCEIVGDERAKTSLTSEFIQKHYGCRYLASTDSQRADLIVWIGTRD